MEVAKKKRSTKRQNDTDGKYYLKKKKDKKLEKIFMFSISAVFLIWCAVSISSDKKETAESKAVLEELIAEAENLEAENAGYESIINETDERSYMERIAVELYGYAYPSERRFYDTTRS